MPTVNRILNRASYFCASKLNGKLVSEGFVSETQVPIFYRQFGSSGPYVVVIHGGPGWDHTYLLPIKDSLSCPVRLLFFDIRACGRSGSPSSVEELSLDDLLLDLRGLLDELDITKAILLGFSFGGRVALRFSEFHPSYVSALILASTTAYTDFQHDFPSEYFKRCGHDRVYVNDKLLHDTSLSYSERNSKYIFNNLDLDIYDLNFLPFLRRLVNGMKSNGLWTQALVEGAIGTIRHSDYSQILIDLGIPVLIVHGEYDMRFPVSVAKRLKAEVSDAELAIISGAGHLTYIEEPEQWAEIVGIFIVRSIEREAQIDANGK